MTLLDLYIEVKSRFLDNCTQCGLCAKGCPILPYTDVSESSSRGIQKGVFDFMDHGIPNQRAYIKAFACMECFKCTEGMCPEGLNPMLVNEIIKGEYISRGLAVSAFSDPQKPDSAHRVMASIQVSASEYKSITTPNTKQKARYVFFPGCNVYYQPEKILNALDIMEGIGNDYAFLPGLDYCCGNNHLFFGDIEEGNKRSENLVAAIARFHPEAVVLWCPTCHCRLIKNISPSTDVPFKFLSFPQYVAANMNKLLVTVCHYCNQTFAAEGSNYDFTVVNYVNLVAEAMGIRRDDKFNKYALWRNLDRILKDVDNHISISPFESERIFEVLQATFTG